MKMSRKAFVTGVLFFGVLALGVPSAGLFWLTHQKDILPLTENKVGEILGAKVRIGALKVGLFNEVNVTGLQIQEYDSNRPLAFEVAQIKVRYNWLSLFQGKAINPARIILDAPNFRLRQGSFPFEYFRSFHPSKSLAAVMPALEFRDGVMEFDLKAWNEKIRATQLTMAFQMRPNGTIDLKGAAKLEGLVFGKLEFHGSMDPWRETYQLNLKTRSIRFSKNFPVPLEEIQGEWQLTQDKLELKSLEAQVHGWKFKISGRVSDLGAEPQFKLRVFPPGDGESVVLSGGISQGRLSASLEREGRKALTLQGRLEYQSDHVRLTEVLWNDHYDGEIILDFLERTLQAHFEQIGTRYRLDLNYELRRANAEMHLQLDHYDFSGLDLTTDMSISLQPVYLMQNGRLWKFKGEFKTNYFILEGTPLEDFRGRFELSSEGVHNLGASWGKHFNLAGNGRLRESVLEGDLEIQIKDFDVAGVEQLLNKPLPKKLGGLLTGKIQLNGVFPKPNVSGHLSIQDGWLGNLEYDLAMIQLVGTPPLLYLKDSKVHRGRTKLNLTGMINLTLPNILHDIRYQQPDNMIAWKAFQWESDENDGDIEVKKRGFNLPSLAIRAGANSGQSSTSEKKESQSGEKYIAVGPKIRF